MNACNLFESKYDNVSGLGDNMLKKLLTFDRRGLIRATSMESQYARKASALPISWRDEARQAKRIEWL
jgi:hypothetical protein